MAVLAFPTGLKAPSRYSPGVQYVQVRSQQLGPVSDVLHRYMLRTLTFEWDSMSNRDFSQVDALVDLLRGSAGTVAVPWRPYQEMIGGGTGSPTVTGSHAAGSNSIDSGSWGGVSPELAQGDWITITVSGVPRIYRVIGFNPTGDIITIEPPLRETVPGGTAINHLRTTGSGDAFLRTTMELVDPNSVQGQVWATPSPQYGRGIILSFVEAVRPSY